MAAVLRKRKIIDTHYGDQPVQLSIASFGRVSKAGARIQGKKNTALQQKVQVLQTKGTQAPAGQPEPKRRRVAASPIPTTQPAKSAATTPEHAAKPKKSQPQRAGPSKLGEPRRVAPLKTSRRNVPDSPTQGARAILEAFVIAPQPAQPQPTTVTADQPTSVPPPARHELTDLHAAFVAALSLHYAHNGTASPADLRALCPSIAQAWGKRRIESDDVRRVLGVQYLATTTKLPRLSLVDFGHGRVCVEFDADDSTPSPHAQPLPAAAMKAAFARGLLTLNGEEPPLAAVVSFVSQAAAVNARGAQRLRDIKAPALNAKNNLSPTQQLAAAKTQAPAASRGVSLLDRIRAKEALAAALPGLTPEQAARRAALQRLPDVVPVLSVLASRNGCGAPSAGAGRSAAASDLAASLGLGGGSGTRPTAPVSFTMATLVQHLQQSLRHPIAREEAERCVELLAAEVLPRWVQVARLGGVTSVSVRGTVGRAEWTGRVEACLAQH